MKVIGYLDMPTSTTWVIQNNYIYFLFPNSSVNVCDNLPFHLAQYFGCHKEPTADSLCYLKPEMKVFNLISCRFIFKRIVGSI